MPRVMSVCQAAEAMIKVNDCIHVLGILQEYDNKGEINGCFSCK